MAETASWRNVDAAQHRRIEVGYWIACCVVVAAFLVLPGQLLGQAATQPHKKKPPVKPTMAARSGKRETRTRNRAGQKPPQTGSGVEISSGKAVVPSEFRGDVRDLPQYVTPEERKLFSLRPEFEMVLPVNKSPLPGAVPETPTQLLVPAAPMPTPSISFNGMNFTLNGAGHPPDTVGDVGPSHYVQAVNTSIGIYNKTTGIAISTFSFNTLWAGAGTGTPCDTANMGDPTVIYSRQNDRFIVADFAWSNIVDGPYYECIAVSKTANPVTGGWWLFASRADDAAHPWRPDYPKMSIWPDGLYMSANMFDCLTAGCGSATYMEARVYGLNIIDLVNGAALRSIVVDTNSVDRFTLLPSNFRGTAPPVGRPNFVVGESQTAFAWEVFKFHVDYVTPANSTFTGPTSVSQASYAIAADPVPQPAPGNNTDTLPDRAMMQNQYRNLAGVESLWVNHTTGTVAASTPTGIQWAQINVTGATINTTPVQQQIFNNGADGLNRFMGALAVDHDGNMALGYSASSASVAPDIRYAGRLSTDPLNALPQTEVTLLPAVTRSVQTGSCGGTCTRWGDYSAMSVDPVDECTFWYTNLYFPVQGTNWVTRIGSFKFPTCVSQPTSANFTIGGRIQTASGRAIPRAFVTLTDQNGQDRVVLASAVGTYRFLEVESGLTYTLTVRTKGYQFTPQVLFVTQQNLSVDFTAQ